MEEPALLVPQQHAHDPPLFYLAYYQCVVVIGGDAGMADVAMLAHRNGVCLLAPLVGVSDAPGVFYSVQYHVSTATEKSAGGMKKRLHRNDPNILRAGDLLATVAVARVGDFVQDDGQAAQQDGITQPYQVRCPVRCKLVELNTSRLQGCATNRWHREGWLAVVQLPEHELPAADGTRVVSLAQYAALHGLPEGCFAWLSKALGIVGSAGDTQEMGEA